MLTSSFTSLLINSVPWEFIKVMCVESTLVIIVKVLGGCDSEDLRNISELLNVIFKLLFRVYVGVKFLKFLEFLLIVFCLI